MIQPFREWFEFHDRDPSLAGLVRRHADLLVEIHDCRYLGLEVPTEWLIELGVVCHTCFKPGFATHQ